MTTLARVKVAELEGADLDYWVARAEGYIMEREQDGQMVRGEHRILIGPQPPETREHEYSPSTKWDQGGPLLERHHIWLSDDDDGVWTASFPPHIDANGKQRIYFGPTPLIAAMRAIVASVYGEEVPNG